MTFDQSSLPFEYATSVFLYENEALWYHLHDNECSIFDNQHFHHKETHHSWILPFSTLQKLINLHPYLDIPKMGDIFMWERVENRSNGILSNLCEPRACDQIVLD